jgi:SulP family sulfate permease
MRPKITEVSRYKDGELRDVELFWLKTNKKISVIRFDGTLYFANAWYLEWEVLNLINKKVKLEILIIDLTWMNNIDSTWQEVFERLVENLDTLWIEVYICGVRPKVTAKFVKIWFLKKFWDGKVFSNVDEILKDIEDKYGKKEYNINHLKYYLKDKKKEPQLEKKVIKTIK